MHTKLEMRFSALKLGMVPQLLNDLKWTF